MFVFIYKHAGLVMSIQYIYIASYNTYNMLIAHIMHFQDQTALMCAVKNNQCETIITLCLAKADPTWKVKV